MSNQAIEWPGKRGGPYTYWFLEGQAKDEPGNYMFVRRAGQGWEPVYIGQTENLRRRIEQHKGRNTLRRLGATHVMGHTTPTGAAARRVEEVDLIQRWRPSGNEVLYDEVGT